MAARPFPTAKELDLWDVELPEGMSLSVMPPAREYMIDPFWYDQGGRDPVDQAFIFRMDAGPKRSEKLQKIVEAYPRYGPRLYEKFAAEGRLDLLRELKDLGASTNVEEAKREVENGEGDDVEDKDRVPSVDMDIPILKASSSGHLDCIKFFVEEADNDINDTGGIGDTALTHAVVRGHLEIVRWLLAHGARITLDKTDDRQDDIYFAMKSGNIDVAKALLDHEKLTPRTLQPSINWVVPAAASGSRDILTLALQLNGFPDAGSDSTNTKIEPPQLIAAQEDILLEEALPHAVGSASLDSVQLLLSYLCARNGDGQFTPRSVSPSQAANVFNATEDAMEKADNDTLFELVWDTILSLSADGLAAHDSTVGKLQEQLDRRLISACSEGCPRIAKLLCEKYGADVNHLSRKFFSTPLARAVGSGPNPFAGRFAAAQYLLQRPEIDIHLSNAKYCNGPTALVMAVQEADAGNSAKADTLLPMVKLMLDHGGPLEDIDQDLIHHLESLPPDMDVDVYVVVYNDAARLPVRLMLEHEYNNVEDKHPGTIKAVLKLKAAEALKILMNAQTRKRDAVLAASDPKRRPLKSDSDKRQGIKTQLQEQMEEADEAKLHDLSIHAIAP